MLPISIWQPSEKDGRPVWERPQPEVLGDHYADTRYLWPKTADSPSRLCFFGESVAAGYLFAPHVTPAKVLQAQFDYVVGPDAYEVIDLARTNETLAGLVETVRQSIQLEPDFLVIFAGNNWNLLETPEWSPYLPGVKGRQRYAEQLMAGGLEAVIETAAKERLQKVWLALAEIGVIAREAAVPVILIVPEVNLADWENCQPVHWLDGLDLARWYTFLAQAQKALRREDWEAAAMLARQMLDLDGGFCPTAYRLLVRANLGLGKVEVARKAAEAEIGSSHYATMAFLGAPQAGPADQEILRRAAVFNDFTLVDLPQVFRKPYYSDDRLPDRTLFLDYCHLTIRGMAWAMEPVVRSIFSLVGDTENWEALDILDWVNEENLIRATNEVIATAYLGTAIHNAHRLGPVTGKQELLKHWCLFALAQSPGIHKTMIDFVSARSLRVPAVITAEQQRLYDSPYLLQHQHGWKYDHMDVDMIQAVTSELEKWDPLWAEEVREVLFENIALGIEPISLLDPYFDAEPLRRLFIELTQTPDLTAWGIYRAFWPVSRFYFVLDGSSYINLDLNIRVLKSVLPETRVKIMVNRKKVIDIDARLTWTFQEVVVESSFTQRGLNELAIQWPYPNVKKEDVWEEVIGRLEQGLEAAVHPVYGEIETLKVRLAKT